MAVQDLLKLIGILAILWIVWFFMGGANSQDTDKPFVKPPAPIDTGIKYGPQ
jgi:hypothetical protein